MRLIWTFLIAAAALAGSVPATSAQDSQAKSRLNEIQKRGVLRVGMTGDYFPMTFRDPGVNEFKGHQVDALAGGDRRTAAASPPPTR